MARVDPSLTAAAVAAAHAGGALETREGPAYRPGLPPKMSEARLPYGASTAGSAPSDLLLSRPTANTV